MLETGSIIVSSDLKNLNIVSIIELQSLELRQVVKRENW